MVQTIIASAAKNARTTEECNIGTGRIPAEGTIGISMPYTQRHSPPPQTNEPTINSVEGKRTRNNENHQNQSLQMSDHIMELMKQETLRHLEFAWEAQRKLALLCVDDDIHVIRTVQNLPEKTKISLYIAVSLGLVSPAWKVLSLEFWKNYCMEAHANKILTNWSTEMFYSAVETLRTKGLIEFKKSDEERDSNARFPKYLQVVVSLEDVEAALGSPLLEDNNFYVQLVKHVKKIDINQEGGG